MKSDNYKEFFTKELMMGPNAIRMLEEMLMDYPEAIRGGRVMDLGCGMALTSLFLARETNAEQVLATDLWISASQNWKQIKAWGLDNKIIPMHADALNLPYPDDFFDAIISVDSYHYYGIADNFFADKMLPLLKKDCYALLMVPGLKKEFEDEIPEIIIEWAGEEAVMFHSAGWWEEHIKQSCADRVEVCAYESKQFSLYWKEWIESGHEFALQDQKFFKNGMEDILNFVIIAIKKLH